MPQKKIILFPCCKQQQVFSFISTFVLLVGGLRCRKKETCFMKWEQVSNNITLLCHLWLVFYKGENLPA